MAFSHIIAHRIQRMQPNASASLQLRPDVFGVNGKLEELAYELKVNFIRKGGKFYGRFSAETVEFPFSSWLKEFREERVGFESFTHKAMKHLSYAIEKTENAFDGYVFFLIEKIEAGETLYVFVVEHTHSVYLDAELAISDSYFLNSSQFTLAAKISLNDWEAGDSVTYLALLRERGEKELSDAFTEFLGFSDKHDVKNDTVEFLKIVDNFTESLDETTAKMTRNKVVDYCLEQHKAGKSVVIHDLSNSLSDELKTYEPDHFSRYVASTQDQIKAEFIPDTAQVRSYARISGRNDSLSMSFDAECLGNNIHYDPASDSLTIKNLPPALKARLIKHLQGK
ncbi:MAG: nucleoid-associated protein [Gammaproteobacteria bacterium]|nr:MAG: nucleoid-associated protein [Gammaproteobacteria bacterium]